jgi:hypothetical protein
VPCNGEIGIHVVGLPRIAGQTDFPRNGGALNALIHVSAKKIQNKRNTYIQMFPKQIHLLFKRMDDFGARFSGGRYGDALHCLRCNIEHGLELGITKHLNRLKQTLKE